MPTPNLARRGIKKSNSKSLKKTRTHSGITLPKLSPEATWELFKKPRVPKTATKTPIKHRSKNNNNTKKAILVTQQHEYSRVEERQVDEYLSCSNVDSCIFEEPPLDEDQFRRLKTQFDLTDTGQGLTWSEIRTMATTEHVSADYGTYKRLEKDKTNKVEFEDVLRILFPKIKTSDVKWLIKNWGSSENDRSNDRGGESLMESSGNLDEEQLKDLRDIFDYFCSFTPNGTSGSNRSQQQITLSRETLRNALLNNPHIHDCITKENLTFQDFTELMHQATSGFSTAQKTKIHYCFVPKPQPIPEL